MGLLKLRLVPPVGDCLPQSSAVPLKPEKLVQPFALEHFPSALKASAATLKLVSLASVLPLSPAIRANPNAAPLKHYRGYVYQCGHATIHACSSAAPLKSAFVRIGIVRR